jgi:hypothetical protein
MRTHRSIWFLALVTVLAVSCKKKEDEAPRPVEPAPMPVDRARDTVAPRTFPLGTSEQYYGGQTATNPLVWKTADGTEVQLALVTTGKNDAGREVGVLRAWTVGKDGQGASQDLQTFQLQPGIDHWAELKPLPNGRVLFRFGEADSGPVGRNAVILAWDADDDQVRLAKRWRGEHTDVEPGWLVTGAYQAAADAEASCAKVVARIVACGQDPKFRESLFRNASPAERADMETHFDTHLASWKKPAEVQAQCQRWAGDDFVDTSFAAPTRLARLAADTKMSCEYFGREIDDEGGLPRSAVDAKRSR